MKTTNMHDDEDVVVSGIQDQLGYFFESQQMTQYTVPIDEDIGDPAYYRGIVNMLSSANEQDIVIFRINSRGGRMDGLLSLLDAIETTEAMTIADIVGECASAASILALNCDQCVAGKYAEMLCHEVRYGVGGKSSDNISHVQHIKKIADKLIWNTYEGFLSNEEIESVLNGKELFLDSDDIVERLNNRQAIREAGKGVGVDNPGLSD